ncbi:Uncharacterised protein [Cedecea lapagei]|uniref:Lipoprotein n=1 Tax=Cedecea lapagei TaxID=158823 RepID=A0A3S4IG95_9ENTR|nr:hypothetical protein [Cedecea lapagei]VEC00518.1 Uncharacterised protein [Cedecea lapagei]
MALFKNFGWILPVLLISGCDNSNNFAAEKTPQTIALPALPVIQSAVMSLVPMPNGQRNELMMSQVCALARGELTQQQVAQNLLQQGIDLSRVPLEGNPLSILVDQDGARRMTACAAYVATSVMEVPKTKEFMVEAKTPAASGKKSLEVDVKKLNYYLGVQLAVARSNADIFALIANELSKKDGLTLEQYNQSARNIFANNAGLFLQRVNEIYDQGQNIQYTLLDYADNHFKFTTSNGYLFEFGYDGLNLNFNRIPWYSGDYLLGKSYMLNVNYLVQPKPTQAPATPPGSPVNPDNAK